jgi:hypothetical protein
MQAEELFESCKRVADIDESYLYSLDYILAMTEYEDFYSLMMQYKV